MRLNNFIDEQRGFSLVEILVVLAIAGVITSGVVNFMVFQSRSYNLQDETREMEGNARLAIEILSDRLQRASSALVDTDPNGNGAVPGSFGAGDDATLAGEGFSFVPPGGNPSVDITSGRIVSSISNDIAYFITQDMDGDVTTPEAPIFQYDDPANPGICTLTIIARTRNPDPNFAQNGGYRQILLTKNVVIRN
ncbi:MAG: PilW family protein [Planctomycetota bacterium]|jgi:prepilin-type N-terminal cleavage/methylation domain-containing protein